MRSVVRAGLRRPAPLSSAQLDECPFSQARGDVYSSRQSLHGADLTVEQRRRVAFSALKGDLMFTLYLAGVRKLLARAAQEQSGQGLSEYALILVLIAIICFVALELLGADLASMLSSAAQAI